MLTVGRIKSQQLADRVSTGLVDCGANCHLHCFQIQLAGAMTITEDSLELVL